MTKPNEPILTSVAIADLKPTQITVGMREVEIKRKLWQAKSPKKGERFLGQHMVPTILGPKGHHYIIDHHHLARALHDEGVKDVLVRPLADLGRLEHGVPAAGELGRRVLGERPLRHRPLRESLRGPGRRREPGQPDCQHGGGHDDVAGLDDETAEVSRA